MSYTKGEFIEQIFLKISGGQPSPDVNVKREDIEAYLAQAINYVTTEEIRQRRREDEMTSIDPEFYKTYENLEPVFDANRNLYYLNLPERLQAIPSQQGIASVAPMWGEVPYIRLRSRYELGTHTKQVDNVFYWYEQLGGSGGKERIYFNKMGYPIPFLVLRMIPSFESLDNDDIVNLPGGIELRVLDFADKWFAGQRQFPADMLNNNNDDKQ